ncbi:ModE family transcriptional regulator [Novosphingobium sp. AAP83]|uniref:winged helix-turn-helix domain-containing protein n=1 Tax=Novosphingobium sp. AAP83 TaxID=1523425 RepID=UPI0006B8C91B|nr:LysR family transcriptional regulator [Novosphingobium sp. AAP83]KPF91466.1 ModE family transcriptional regulator [Novosphingobium sp. AAP83]
MEQRLKLKIQLYCGNEIAMGPGKADLLSAIALHGSISAAARAMDMSYRRAWLLTDAMNRCWREALVETSPGSAKGGGAKLTPMGEQVLSHYRALQERIAGSSDCGDYAALANALLPAPKGRQKDGMLIALFDQSGSTDQTDRV